jgi:hypothetical protein
MISKNSQQFITDNSDSLKQLFGELASEKLEEIMTLDAGEERDRQIEFIKALRKWIIVLEQYAPRDKVSFDEKAI